LTAASVHPKPSRCIECRRRIHYSTRNTDR